MKKFLALAMALCLSVTCLAGCTNDKDPDASQTPDSSVEQPVDDEQQQTETETPDVTDDEQDDESAVVDGSEEQPVEDSDAVMDDGDVQDETDAGDMTDDDEKDVNSSVSFGAAD